jgi:putative redox protein
MKHSVTTAWQGEMHFISKNDLGEVPLDAGSEVGGQGKGFRSKPFMLTSLTGCTGMDVASLLKKMRVEPAHFEVQVEATLTDEHPKYYDTTHIKYIFEGKDLDQAKITKAVDLSFNKYCGVIEMFKAFSKVTFEIIYR